MALATIDYDASDYSGVDFDPRRTKVYATNNADDGVVHDVLGNKQYIGSGNGTIEADGTGSIEVPIPGTGFIPASWQTTIHFDGPDRNSPRSGRKVVSFGPYTITASGTLGSLIEQQAISPTYLEQVSGALEAYVDSASASATSASSAATSAAASAALAQDISNIDDTDSAVAAALALPGSLSRGAVVPSVITQDAITDSVPVFKYQPDVAAAPFQQRSRSFPNGGAGAGTYNNAMWFGWNAGRHAQDGSATPNEQAVYMGFEDNFFDPVADFTYGVEWYVGYISPDGTSVGIGDLRPFYFRVLDSDTNDPDKSVHLKLDIGSGADGEMILLAGAATDEKVMSYTKDVALTKTTTQFAVQSPLSSHDNAAGPAVHRLNGTTNSQFDFKLNFATAFSLSTQSVDQFVMYDKAGNAVTVWNYGASNTARSVDVRASQRVRGRMSVAPDTGIAESILDGPGGGDMIFRVAGANAYDLAATNVNQLVMYDKVGNPVTVWTQGANPDSRVTDFRSVLRIGNTTATAATAGAASALPATPSGYFVIQDSSGTNRKVAFYNS